MNTHQPANIALLPTTDSTNNTIERKLRIIFNGVTESVKDLDNTYTKDLFVNNFIAFDKNGKIKDPTLKQLEAAETVLEPINFRIKPNNNMYNVMITYHTGFLETILNSLQIQITDLKIIKYVKYDLEFQHILIKYKNINIVLLMEIIKKEQQKNKDLELNEEDQNITNLVYASHLVSAYVTFEDEYTMYITKKWLRGDYPEIYQTSLGEDRGDKDANITRDGKKVIFSQDSICSGLIKTELFKIAGWYNWIRIECELNVTVAISSDITHVQDDFGTGWTNRNHYFNYYISNDLDAWINEDVSTHVHITENKQQLLNIPKLSLVPQECLKIKTLTVDTKVSDVTLHVTLNTASTRMLDSLANV